ncbi:MAG TPA: hypothetical protein VK730_13670 [Solirubrobacteraceae bacterium]|jgi:hypothetical protein|nr:hypothetical protein [Solirubrobacteraceae bacterium]
MANPLLTLPGNPFAGAQKEAAKKVAQAKAKLPVPYSQTKAGQRALKGAESLNRTGIKIAEEGAQKTREAGNKRLGLPLTHQPAPNQKATVLSPRERVAAYKPGQDAITLGHLAATILSPAPQGAAVASPFNVESFAKGLATAAKNTPGSALRTVTGTVPGLVATGKAAVHAAEGNPKELEAMGKSLLQVAEHPWTSFQKEPVPVGLMALGAEGSVGRLAGAAMRSGALGDKVAEAASMDRAPLHLYGTSSSADQVDAGLHDVAIPRKYSPDVIRKAGQVAADTFKEKILHQDPNMATGEQANRYLYGGSLVSQHTFKRAQGFFKPGLVDEQAAKGETLRRLYSGAAAHTMRELKPKTGAEAVPLAVEGILRRPETVVADLTKEHQRLQDTAQGLTGKELRLNKANQRQIDGLLADKKFLANPQPAFQAAREYADWSAPLEQRLVQLGHLEPDQINAKLVPYALSHMGKDVAYNENPGKHPLALAEKSAGKQVKAAQKALERARGGTNKTAVAEARSRLADARGAHHTVASDLQGLKAAGFIKSNGDMYPRLEQAGRPLAPDAIRAHMKQELVDRGVGFLTHKQDQTFGKALESYAGKRPGTEVRSRTGVSFKNGTYDRSYQALSRQAYRHANAIAGHENRDEMLRRFGIGRFHTLQDAERALDNFAHTPEGKLITKANSLGDLTPHLIGPDRVVAQRNVETRALGPILRDFGLAEHKAINETADAPKYTLLPETVSKRIGEHDKLNQATQGKRLLQWYTNKWRSAALFTSPRWLLGNPQEHAIRLAMANVNPAAIFGAGKAVRLGKDIVDHWHSIAADQSRTEAERYVARAHAAAYSAGTHYGSIAVNAVHRGAEDAPAADFAQALNETGPVSKIVGVWSKWKGAIGQGMAKVEQNSKAAALGKAALNETHKFMGDWQKLIGRQDTAVKKFAEGKLSPNEASKLGNDQMDMMGNWSQLPPAVRSAVQTWSPFGLWWLTSMKFVFRTLPRDHPMKTAALAAMEAATHTASSEAETPSYLQGGVKAHLPIVGDVTLTPEYYSPFGVGVDPGVTAAGQVLPQVTDPYLTMRGVDPVTNEALKNSSKEPLDPGHLTAQALYSTLEGLVPGLRQGVQLAQEGGRPEPGSFNPLAVEPGSQRGIEQTLAKIFSPVKYTAGKRESKSTGKKIKPGFGVPAGLGKAAGLGQPAGFGKPAGP